MKKTLIVWFCSVFVLLLSVPVFAFDVLGWVTDITGSPNPATGLFDVVGEDSNVIGLTGILLVGLAFMWGVRKLIKTVNRS